MRVSQQPSLTVNISKKHLVNTYMIMTAVHAHFFLHYVSTKTEQVEMLTIIILFITFDTYTFVPILVLKNTL